MVGTFYTLQKVYDDGLLTAADLQSIADHHRDGTYNGTVAIMVNDPYHDHPAVELDINETIAGVLFHYTNPNIIVVWKK